MPERSVQKELTDLEHEWLQAISRDDMEKLESIVGHEYTLTANGFPGGRTRISRQEWMATVPAYEVHSYEFGNIVVKDYALPPWCSLTLTCRRPSEGRTEAVPSP